MTGLRISMAFTAVFMVSSCAAAAMLLAQDVAPLLPDLEPDAPSGAKAFVASDWSRRIFLTFNVAINNIGAGPLTVHGSRSSAIEPTMVADQVIQLSDGTTTTTPRVGSLEYYQLYARWGFTPYQVYELYRASDLALVRIGPDLNFCVEDNAKPSPVLPGEPQTKVYSGCGKKEQNLLELDLGISVGWANRHSAGNTGQMIDITSLPAGDYILVHRVNPSGLLTESSTANNASSARVRITWVSWVKVPIIETVRRCLNTPIC